MNTHSKVRDLLALAASGLLSDAEEKLVHQHLQECAACAAELDRWRLITGALSQRPAPQFSASLAQQTVSRVKDAYSAQSEKRVSAFFLSFAIGFGWLFCLVSVLFFAAAINHFSFSNIGSASIAVALLLSTVFTIITAGVAAWVLMGAERKTLYVSFA